MGIKSLVGERGGRGFAMKAEDLEAQAHYSTQERVDGSSRRK
jgi:hypothetical protein